MALLQAVLSDPNNLIVTYPTFNGIDRHDHDDIPTNKPSKPNILRLIWNNVRQFLNILPGLYHTNCMQLDRL